MSLSCLVRSQHFVTYGAADIESYILAQNGQTILHGLRDGNRKRSYFGFWIKGIAENTHTYTLTSLFV